MSEAATVRYPVRTVIVLTVVAAAVRLVGLDGGLWIDEIYSLIDSFRPPLAAVLTEFPGDTQHPLYSVLANVSLKLFGESPWSIRLPAVLFGVASVPMLYLLGARIAGTREALLAAALLAVSYHHVWFSQNARGYTMLAFWALLSTHLLHKGLREGGRRLFVAYGVVLGLGVYTHLTLAFMVAAQALVAGIWLLARRRAEGGARAPDVLLGFGVGVATGAMLYAPIFMQVIDFFLNTTSRLEGISTPSWALFEALRVLGIGLGTGVGLLGAAALLGLGALDYGRRDALALALFTVPGAVTLVGALMARGTMYPRFYFFMIGFAFLILMRGAYVVGGFVDRRIGRTSIVEGARGLSVGTVMAIGVILVSLVSLRANYAAPKQDFAGALEFVETAASPTDIIATVGVTTYPYQEYFRRSFAEVTDLDSLEQLRRGGQSVWVLHTFERYLDVALLDGLRQQCESARVFAGTVGGGAITVSSCPPSPPRPEGAP
jgi:4-amino-4-deoxy-L-arabinose transferase-like glycosyltransferase